MGVGGGDVVGVKNGRLSGVGDGVGVLEGHVLRLNGLKHGGELGALQRPAGNVPPDLGGDPVSLHISVHGAARVRPIHVGALPLKAPEEYYVPELPDKAVDGKELKAGVIGCGGRGSGAAENFLNAANGVTIAALGDVFDDRLQGLKNSLKEKYQIDVPADKCFTGFDAYQKVIDSGVDVVIIATPPFFRPEHFKYAVEKGVHCFLEKPICVDPEGYRTIIRQCREADIQIPIFAIGGIRFEDIEPLMQAGVDGIAVSGALIQAEDPTEETRRYIREIRRCTTHPSCKSIK